MHATSRLRWRRLEGILLLLRWLLLACNILQQCPALHIHKMTHTHPLQHHLVPPQLCDTLPHTAPPHLCTKMVLMPREVAMAQACCAPAPPKQASTWAAASYPFIWVSALQEGVDCACTRSTR
jgi:hypothetical protein